MGLDIYAHRVTKAVIDKYDLSMDVNEIGAINDALRQETANKFKKTTNAMLSYLRKVHKACNEKEYRNEYYGFIKRLKKNLPLYKMYNYKFDALGYNAYSNELVKVLTPNEVETIFDYELKHCFIIEDAYFRKVNFIYAFFIKELENESCIVDKHRISQLIDACEDVLAHYKDEDYAQEVLPTQSGFFFGSTLYDDWYWEDVKNCLTQMKRLYKSMSDDDFVLWHFSW